MIDFNAKKGFLCDMDGVIYHGNHILPGAAEFIHWLQDEHKEYLFLTNNSGMTPRELCQKLQRMGLDVPEEHFYTSALATAAFLADQAPGCSVYALGEAGLRNALYDRGITMNDVNPDYVVIGEARAYSLDTLTKATNLVLAGAKLIGANSDVSGPIENGIAPACRALVAPIEMATGKQAYFCGKPNPLMMRTGLRMLHCHSGDAVMVGDRMDTDVISGLESGMSTVLVLSGVSTRQTVETYAYQQPRKENKLPAYPEADDLTEDDLSKPLPPKKWSVTCPDCATKLTVKEGAFAYRCPECGGVFQLRKIFRSKQNRISEENK